MTTPSMSVIDDKGTAKLLLDLNGRDVLVTRDQLEAMTLLVDPASVTVAHSRALQMMADSEIPCQQQKCGERPTVSRDQYGARRCQMHEDAANAAGWSAS